MRRSDASRSGSCGRRNAALTAFNLDLGYWVPGWGYGWTRKDSMWSRIRSNSWHHLYFPPGRLQPRAQVAETPVRGY